MADSSLPPSEQIERAEPAPLATAATPSLQSGDGIGGLQRAQSVGRLSRRQLAGVVLIVTLLLVVFSDSEFPVNQRSADSDGADTTLAEMEILVEDFEQSRAESAIVAVPSTSGMSSRMTGALEIPVAANESANPFGIPADRHDRFPDVPTTLSAANSEVLAPSQSYWQTADYETEEDTCAVPGTPTGEPLRSASGIPAAPHRTASSIRFSGGIRPLQ